MTWSYSGDPSSSDKDLVRFLIGDTVEADPLLSDEEIQFLLTTQEPRKAAEEACERIIANLAREIDYTIGPESVKASQRLRNYRSLLHALKQGNTSGYAGPILTGGRSESVFDLGMHDWHRGLK